MIYIMLMIISIIVGMIIMDAMSSYCNRYGKYELEIKKWNRYFQIMNLWLDMKQQGGELIAYMKRVGYLNVAIYGMSDMGNRLFNELHNSDINIVCVIDRRKNILGEFKLITPDDVIPDVDVIVVCAEFYYNEIKKELSCKTNCPIITLSGLLGNAFNRNI